MQQPHQDGNTARDLITSLENNNNYAKSENFQETLEEENTNPRS